MARSFTQMVNSSTSDFCLITNDTSSANIALGKFWVNQALRELFSLEDWNFNRTSVALTSVANQQNYTMPGDTLLVERAQVFVANQNYTPDEVTNGKAWYALNRTTVSSDIPLKWYFDDVGKFIGLYPIPITSGNTITAFYQYKLFDLGGTNRVDYTTGTVTGVVGTNTVTGAGTTFTSSMVGMYIQPNNYGFWYLITAVPTTTSLTLQNNITAAFSGASYTIAELIPLPDGFEFIPLYWALTQYFTFKENAALIKQYGAMHKDKVDTLLIRDSRTARGLLTQDPLGTISNPINDPNTVPEGIVQLP